MTLFRCLQAAASHLMMTVALLLARDRRATIDQNITYVEELTGQDYWAVSPDIVRSILRKR